MHFSINRRYFLDALNVISRAIPIQSPVPALSCIYIQVLPDRIILTGSDTNIAIRSELMPSEENQLTIWQPGSILMEGKYLLEIIRKMESAMVEMEMIDLNLVRISNNNGQYNLNGMQPEKYPDVDFSTPEKSFQISMKNLKDAILQTSFACSDKEARPVLRGVNFHARDGKLYCSATDSYRLARKETTIPDEMTFNFTLPAKALQEVVKSLDDSDILIRVYANPKRAQFDFGNTIIQTRLLDGKFPNVDSIIPKSSVSVLEVDALEIFHAIDRTNFIRQEKVHLVKLVCSEYEVRIKTNSADIGNSDEALITAKYTGDDMTLHINGTFLLDAIKALHADKIKLEFTGSMSAFKVSGSEDESAVMVIVPVRSYE